MLLLDPTAIIRPMAIGCLALVGDRQPMALGELHEQIVTTCQRPTSRDELVELLSEVGGIDPGVAAVAIDDLVDFGVLINDGFNQIVDVDNGNL